MAQHWKTTGKPMQRICVFCGSKSGDDDIYRDAATELGGLLAGGGHSLVFGGGSVGLMGVVADAVLAGGGEAIGVLPEQLATRELQHPGVADMRIVPNMHARKALMSELSDAFIAMPGGLGTFEELFEVLTWAQLGFHRKNIGLLNVGGFFDPLVRLIDHSIQEGFVKQQNRELFVVEERPDKLLDALSTHELPEVRRWLGPESV